MPTLRISTTVELAYDDSGVPTQSSIPTYTTIVIVHGSIFYNKIFAKLLELAPQHNLRLLALNLPDYPGSTPNSQRDLDDMSSGDPNRQARYIKDAGHQIGSFAAKAITELKLPSPTPDRAALAGGVAVLAWSSGTLFLTSLLAHAKTLPKDEYALLSQYVRTAVIFDPAWFTTGHQLPAPVLAAPATSPLYSPMRDMNIPDSERLARFFAWFSGYFEPPVKQLFPLRTDEDVKKAVAMHEARTPTGTPTLQRMSQAEKESVADFSARVRTSNPLLRFTSPMVYKENFQSAFTLSEDDRAVLPNVDILLVWAELSVFETNWAVSTVKDWLENGSHSVQKFGLAPKEIAGNRTRKVRYENIEGCNHFLPWDEPDRVIQFLAKHV